MPQGDIVGTESPTWTTPINGHGEQIKICFPSYYYQVPIDVKLGGLFSPTTPGAHLTVGQTGAM